MAIKASLHHSSLDLEKDKLNEVGCDKPIEPVDLINKLDSALGSQVADLESTIEKLRFENSDLRNELLAAYRQIHRLTSY